MIILMKTRRVVMEVMAYLVLFLIGLIVPQIIAKPKTETVKSLCEDPRVTAADRLPNDTIRVYRGNYYWELPGVADERVKPLGPYKIPLQYMGPLGKNASVMTVCSGPLDGTTWKFEGQLHWQWKPGRAAPEIGGKSGAPKPELPYGGLTCAFNDGDLDGKGYPMMIGFKGIRVYYWKTYETIFQCKGNCAEGYKNGQFNETFPADLTACTAVRLSKPGAPYYVLLFKNDEYCLRPIKGQVGCLSRTGWKKNRALFGCPGSKNDAPKPTKASGDKPPDPEQTGDKEPMVNPNPDYSPQDNAENPDEIGIERSCAHTRTLGLSALLLSITYLLKPF